MATVSQNFIQELQGLRATAESEAVNAETRRNQAEEQRVAASQRAADLAAILAEATPPSA